MESMVPKHTIPDRSKALSCPPTGRILVAGFTTAILVIGTQTLMSQTPADASSSQPVPTHKVAQHRKASPAHTPTIAAVTAPAPAPPAPEAPKWPLNDPPGPPSIRWDSQGLHVAPPNSSLRQILDDVATTTGAKVEGLGPDERVFGDYGPGPARDVISQILHGPSSQALILGDQGQGTPREIILSQRSKGGAQPGQANRAGAADDDVDQPPEPDEPVGQQPPINRPQMQPMNQPGGPMTPQQRMLEMQRQQMQMQQQQQQQGQPIQPPPQPPQ